jgi:hypothetical protein
LRRAPPAVQSRLIEGLRVLPRDELATVSRVLEKIVERLGAEPGAPPMFFEPERARVAKRRRSVGR